MKKIILTFMCCLLVAMTSWAQSSYDTGAPFGFATRTSRTDATDAAKYNITGGGAMTYEEALASSSKIVLTSDGTTAMDNTIKNAIQNHSVIIFDGSNNTDFWLDLYIAFEGLKDKTIIGVNGARLCTKFYLTTAIHQMLNNYQWEKNGTTYTGVKKGSTSSNSNTFGKLPSGASVGEESEYLTRKALIEHLNDNKENFRKAGVFQFKRCENFIIRNLKFVGPGPCDVGGYDLMSMTESTHFWVDHCEFTDGMDGNFDITNNSDFSTISWCTFSYTDRAYAHMNTNLVGSSDSDGMLNSAGYYLNLTFAYNHWGNKCDQRMPMARAGKIHMLNNYYTCKNNSSSINPRKNSEFYIEGNYFADGVKKVFSQTDAKAYQWISSGNRANVIASSGVSTPSSSGTVSIPYEYDNTLAAANVPTEVGTYAGATLFGNSVTPPTLYTVTYNVNGHGTCGTSSWTQTSAGQSTTLPTVTANSSYTFLGWATSSSATTAAYTAGANYTPSANVTLYAVYRQNQQGGGDTPVAGTLMWDYSTAAPTSSPDNGLTYNGIVNDASGTNNGLKGIKLDSNGYAYFTKLAVAGTLSISYGIRKDNKTLSLSIYSTATAGILNTSSDELIMTSTAASSQTFDVTLSATQNYIYIKRASGNEGVITKIVFTPDAAAESSVIWDFSKYDTSLQLTGDNKTIYYDGLLLVGNTADDYVSRSVGFRMNGTSSSSTRYIKFVPQFDGKVTVSYKSNNSAANNRITAIGTSVVTGTNVETLLTDANVLAAGYTNGYTVKTISANLSAGTDYYLYFAEGGQAIVKVEYSHSVADQDEVTATVASTRRFGSFSSVYNVDFGDDDNADVKAYTAVVSNDGTTVTLTRHRGVLPAGEGVVLYAPGETKSQTFGVVNEATALSVENSLIGVPVATNVEKSIAGDQAYVVNSDAFRPLSQSGTIAAGKAYLRIPAAGGSAKVVTMVMDEDATSISNRDFFNEKPAVMRIYNLQGIEVKNPVRGHIYIINNKKCLFK